MRRRIARLQIIIPLLLLLSLYYCYYYLTSPPTSTTPYDLLPLLKKKTDRIYSKLNELELEKIRLLTSTSTSALTPVLLMACERTTVSRALDSIIALNRTATHPIIVSQGCEHQETSSVISKYATTHHLIHLHYISNAKADKGNEHLLPYYKISDHYKYALDIVFRLGFKSVIILEDDMEISVDFFDYFDAFIPLLHQDPTLLCVSSWNDNGKVGRVNSSDVFYRSDFFPGLGWALTRSLWVDELRVKWPSAFWDDWLRLPEQRKGRACIRPEVSRTSNFGKKGVSMGQFFDDHIATIKLNTDASVKYVRSGGGSSNSPLLPLLRDDESLAEMWMRRITTKVDVGRLVKKHYDSIFMEQVYHLSLRTTTQELKEFLASRSIDEHVLYMSNPNAFIQNQHDIPLLRPNTPQYCGRYCARRYTLIYAQKHESDWDDFVRLAREWSLMDDIRANLPRGSYLGVVCFKAEIAYPPVKMNVFNDRKRVVLEESEEERWVEVCIAPERVIERKYWYEEY